MRRALAVVFVVYASLFASAASRTCTKRVLVAMSSASELPITLTNGSAATVPVGFYFDELMIPFQAFYEQGWTGTFGNPLGNTPPMDIKSNSSFYFDPLNATLAEASFTAAWSTLNQQVSFKTPTPYAQMTDSWLSSQDFDALFIPGGHAPMVDLWNNTDLGRIMLSFVDAGKPIASVCHGPVSLLAASTVRKPWPFAGRQMTVFSNAEEAINEMEWGGKLAFLAQTALADAGGIMQERTTLYMPNAVRDLSSASVLVTGQNPFSAPDVAAMLLDELVVLCGA